MRSAESMTTKMFRPSCPLTAATNQALGGGRKMGAVERFAAV